MFNIRPEITSFFKPYFQSNANGCLIFKFGNAAYESWAFGSHIIPSTDEVWLAGAAYPDLITDLYISYSATDLICFTSQRPQYLLRHPEQQAFAALGLLPANSQVQFLKDLFPFARWHLLFSPDLLGKIADVGIASWYKGYHVSFRMNDSRVSIKFRGKAFYLDGNFFSLHRFELATGLRSGIRTHKPPQGLPSFTVLQTRHYYDT
jgi:hypothetical protein